MLVVQLCLTLCNPMDCSLPGSSTYGILQARILEWVAISFSRGSSWPRDQTCISYIKGRFFTLWATKEARLFSFSLENSKTLLFSFAGDSSVNLGDTLLLKINSVCFIDSNPLEEGKHKCFSIGLIHLPIKCGFRNIHIGLTSVTAVTQLSAQSDCNLFGWNWNK